MAKAQDIHVTVNVDESKEALRIEKALDVLQEIAEGKYDLDNFDTRDSIYQRKSAAEEILLHYRTYKFFRDVVENGLTINVNGAIPVRPMTRTEVHGNG